MLRTKKVTGIMMMGVAVVLLAGCYKNVTVIQNGPEITTPVSFSKDIIPIYNKSCNMSGCHNTGGQKPDLTIGNAYRTINEEDLIDVANPEGSEMMGWLTGTIKPAMPLGTTANPSNINALTLAWIKQGAKNN